MKKIFIFQKKIQRLPPRGVRRLLGGTPAERDTRRRGTRGRPRGHLLPPTLAGQPPVRRVLPLQLFPGFFNGFYE
jgi:hypothetical protein